MTSAMDTKNFRILWGLRIMLKWKLFLWKLWHNGIATTHNLYNRQIGTSSECPICLADIEDTQHLFRWCPLAIEIWDRVSLGVQSPSGSNLSFCDWLSHWLIFFSKEDIHPSRLPKFVGALWSIWKSRNDQVFQTHRPTIQSLVIQLQESDKQHDIFLAQTHDPTRNPRDPNTPPGFCYVQLGQRLSAARPSTVQIDGSWDRRTNAGGVAWATTFDPDFIQAQQGRFFFALSALATEATTCLNSLLWAKSTRQLNIKILTDPSVLVQLLQAENHQDISLKWTILRIRILGKTFTSCQLQKVYRLQVSMAHQLAQWCRKNRRGVG
ncbi:uncharacterized protein LOC104893339 [Beta vulgaris subsp. vulgaris]|uniref:uncharacterized protein LOC104893339 n=1 Tax=Beta vulgaris subsp. vulgaris TaxID=3555 RepID=UPI00053F5623|nr:uncharacterized protein LOC104893339 [Beta vulgaris subsp. vulgaris]